MLTACRLLYVVACYTCASQYSHSRFTTPLEWIVLILASSYFIKGICREKLLGPVCIHLCYFYESFLGVCLAFRVSDRIFWGGTKWASLVRRLDVLTRNAGWFHIARDWAIFSNERVLGYMPRVMLAVGTCICIAG